MLYSDFIKLLKTVKLFYENVVDKELILHKTNKYRFQLVNVHNDKNIICLTILSNINLLTQTTEFFTDGTFGYTLNFFFQ